MKNFLEFFCVAILAVIAGLFVQAISADPVSAGIVSVGMIGLLPTPQQKLAKVIMDLYPNANFDDFQGAQTVLFDSLPLAANTTLNFFENVGQRQFPLTNQTDNKLSKGNNLVVERVAFGIMLIAANGNVVDFFPFSGNSFASPNVQFKPLYGSQYSLIIGSSEVIKSIPLVDSYAPFNKASKFGNAEVTGIGAELTLFVRESTQDVIHLDAIPAITENNAYKVQLRTPAFAAVTLPEGVTARVFVKLEGTGSLFAPGAKY